jgi:putative spermidine/putrescine transport system permease protein
MPLAVLPILNVLERINPSIKEAAMSLRAGPVRTFLFVTFPLSLPGVVAASLLIFALTSSAFVAPLVLGGGTVSTLTMLMQQNIFTTLNWPLGAAESLLLVATVMTLIALYRHQLTTSIKHAGK